MKTITVAKIQEDTNFIKDNGKEQKPQKYIKKYKDTCVVFIGGFLEYLCENVNNVICVKEYKKK
ncbi:hypothetical protein BTW14_gp152 [BeAn 58058 virus]|uniref:hypothetical protein n=1 Tax=BeAn 58058 virus TaxID=67082 RepID=UPI00090A1253|nr:hypothetical protein BTW14_gp152 [BeAn 58058 virus]APG58343.1 hypothetical protein BAV00166 [BeAn 58058 virus]